MASQKRSSSPFALALGRLDHHRPHYGPRHRWGVVAVIHEPLGDVHFGHDALLAERTEVEDELVRHAAFLPAVHTMS